MRVVVLAVGLLLVITLGSAIYVVNETEQVIVTQFGEPVGGPVDTPGLKFKIPLVQKIHRFEKRFLEWEGDVEELPTKDKVFVLIDTYARWRIDDPLLFFQRVRNERGAQSRLDDIVDGETRNAIARHNLIEVVRTSNREPITDESVFEAESGVQAELNEIREGRAAIREQILAAAQRRTEDLGIELLDVQFKRINYGDQVLRDVYNRMISERKRISERFRSEGQGEKAKILGDMERELKRVRSEAYRQAEEIRGRADAEATDIYAAAYDQSPASRRFYEFLKTMETFEATVDADTWMVLSTDGDFFRFLEDSGGG
ncbi:MAG: protease modulator HflC [Thermoanaerobaculia bacterium]|nr:protease modulator HflC [Thermoanaerobaculia bacterium]